MDAYSSGEDLVIKTRKPYTITKQRERWTVEEHDRFLEALKLYGRAWQRIEEHIGTKTAVQIRSHAQKFFSKLEKGAVIKGVPMGHLDIDIPPPRPKRKPSNPYPRKSGVGPAPYHVAQNDRKLPIPVSPPHCKQVLDLEKEPLPEKHNREEDKLKNVKGKEVDSSSEVLTILQDVHCSSVSSMNKKSLPPTTEALRNTYSFREFVPPIMNGVHVLEGNQKLDKPDAKQTLNENGSSNASKTESCGALPTDEMEGVQNYPRHNHVHVLTPSDVTFQDPRFHPFREVNGHPSFHSTASATAELQDNEPRSSAQSFLNFPPPLNSTHHTQDDYRSFLHASSAFSNLVVSTLLQNPAATLAATFWPYANVETNTNSPASSQVGGFLPRQINSAPSMAAIATATVAAATAWWAAHGLLPLCAPAFTCPPTAIPSADADQNETASENPPVLDQPLDITKFEAGQAKIPASKSPILSLSESNESGAPKHNIGPKATDHETAAATNGIHGIGKANNRKQVDRSSCGSNTSGSEGETDALEKLQKDKEESKEADGNHAATESNNSRRSRSSSNISDPWKEVSEEGRLAFQALFTREKLPQSFSPPHDQDDDNDETASPLNLNTNIGLHCNQQEAEKITVDCKYDEGLLEIGLGHGKLKPRRTGFKPYKRCSMEAKENRTGEEKCPKRMCVEREPST